MVSSIPALSILVVEDNENLRDTICETLTGLGHHVQGIDCAEALPEQRHFTQLDLVILDLNLPGEDGLSLATRLRTCNPDLGIIMLTARTQSDDRAAGYAQGADIYLTKPASLLELQRAIDALSRRLRPKNTSTGTADAFRLDLLRLQLLRSDGTVIALNPGETALLAAFARAAQQTLETWQIAEVLKMDLTQINKSAVELHIVRLRKKLPTNTMDNSSIVAVRGHGYKLCVALRLIN